MASLLFLLFIFISSHSYPQISAQTQTQSQSQSQSLSAYEVLQQYDLPIGILPIGVTGYELDTTTGRFTLYLNQKCKFSISSYQLEYRPVITGVISQGKITKLRGVSVKIVLFWFNIVEVDNDGDDLRFSVGIISANFPIDSFYQSPKCGCGFDCVDLLLSSS